MKNRFFLLIAALCLTSGVVGAQDFRNDPRYGADPDAREQNVRVLNFFRDAYTAKDYNTATVYLRQLIENAPKASENMYIQGVDIYKTKLQGASSRDQRKVYMDSILWVHDKRIEAFGDHPQRGRGYIKLAKARDVMQLMNADRNRLFRIAEDALYDPAVPVDPNFAVMYFNNVVESFKLDDITPEELMGKYEKLVKRVASQPGTEEQVAAIESLFATSGAASCENIERLFRPKYEADPNNVELIESILALLQRAQCNSDFQMELLDGYYKTNPTPEIALQLSMYFEKKGDEAKAKEYLQVALNSETDPVKKTALIMQQAGNSLAAGSYREAANYARQALNVDPNSGYAYFILGNAYASGSGAACGDFERLTVFWLAVDNLQQARKYLSEEEAARLNINAQINSFVGNFPKKEDTFFRGLEPGQAYTVNCGWISGRTTVRER